MVHDKHGKEIKSGDVLFNRFDREGYYRVLSNEANELFLGDFDSPLWQYQPQHFWEIVDEAKLKEKNT